MFAKAVCHPLDVVKKSFQVILVKSFISISVELCFYVAMLNRIDNVLLKSHMTSQKSNRHRKCCKLV